MEYPRVGVLHAGLDHQPVLDVELRGARATRPLLAGREPGAHGLDGLDPERQGRALAGAPEERHAARLDRQLGRLDVAGQMTPSARRVEPDGPEPATLRLRPVTREAGLLRLVDAAVVEHEVDVPDVRERQSGVVGNRLCREVEFRMRAEIAGAVAARALPVGEGRPEIRAASLVLDVARRASHFVLARERARPVARDMDVVGVEAILSRRTGELLVAGRALLRADGLARVVAGSAGVFQHGVGRRQPAGLPQVACSGAGLDRQGECDQGPDDGRDPADRLPRGCRVGTLAKYVDDNREGGDDGSDDGDRDSEDHLFGVSGRIRPARKPRLLLPPNQPSKGGGASRGRRRLSGEAAPFYGADSRFSRDSPSAR